MNTTMKVPENVLAAMKAVVEWAHSFDPDDTRLCTHDIPVIAAWLEGLGLLPPRLPPGATEPVDRLSALTDAEIIEGIQRLWPPADGDQS